MREREADARIYVADHDQHSVVGRIVGIEKRADVGERSGVEIGKVAVKIVRVGPVAKRDGRQIEPGKAAVRLVQNVDADFFFDDIALIAEVFVVDFEGTHAIGFEPKNSFESVGGNDFEIVGEVVIGGTVENPAGGVDKANVFHLAGVLGALKHHVFEKMGEAGASTRFEAKTDLVINAHSGDGRGVVRRDNDAKAVGERFSFDGNVRMRQRSDRKSTRLNSS